MRPDLYRAGDEAERVKNNACHCGGVYMRNGLTWHQRGTGTCIHSASNVDPYAGTDTGSDPPF